MGKVGFSVISWAYPLLPEMVGMQWQVDWPDDFAGLPRGSIREANNSSGVITTEGEGSALVSFYVDTWHRTPEEREAAKMLLDNTFNKQRLARGMSRDTVEYWADGTKAYRNTRLFSGEWDNGTQRMCTAK